MDGFRFQFEGERRRNLADLVIISALLALLLLAMAGSLVKSLGRHELRYVHHPGAALGFVLEFVYPCLAIASLVVCLTIRKGTPAWLTVMLVPLLAVATSAALTAIGFILYGFTSVPDVSSVLFLTICAALVFLLACAYLLGWRRAWRSTVSHWSRARSWLAVFASLFVLAAVPGLPAMIADRVVRSNLSSLFSTDPNTVRAAVERVRPWIAWTELTELRAVACDTANESGERAARACELLTGVNPRTMGSGYGY